MSYRAIIIDFFGVICSEVAPFWLRRYFSDATAADLKTTLVGAADRGEISQVRLFEELAQRASVTPEEVEAAWHALAKIDSRVVQRLRAWKGQYRLGLLTNSPAPFVHRLLAENRLVRLFDAVVVSSDHGMAKPELGIYHLILRELSVDKAEAFFIDDNATNVDAARRVGMKAAVYTTAEQLEMMEL
jgi:putative hydrolase of the HAD superfamily